jgi:hypothetical protein
VSEDYGPRHPTMTAAEIRAARDVHDRVREGTYWAAAARTASYMDAGEVVRLWRDARRFRSVPRFRRFAQDWPYLVKALDALSDGWPK